MVLVSAWSHLLRTHPAKSVRWLLKVLYLEPLVLSRLTLNRSGGSRRSAGPRRYSWAGLPVPEFELRGDELGISSIKPSIFITLREKFAGSSRSLIAGFLGAARLASLITIFEIFLSVGSDMLASLYFSSGISWAILS